MLAAQDVPEEEREDAMASAMLMLLSSTCTAESIRKALHYRID
jgi:hypothetical protein